MQSYITRKVDFHVVEDMSPGSEGLGLVSGCGWLGSYDCVFSPEPLRLGLTAPALPDTAAVFPAAAIYFSFV